MLHHHCRKLINFKYCSTVDTVQPRTRQWLQDISNEFLQVTDNHFESAMGADRVQSASMGANVVQHSRAAARETPDKQKLDANPRAAKSVPVPRRGIETTTDSPVETASTQLMGADAGAFNVTDESEQRLIEAFRRLPVRKQKQLIEQLELVENASADRGNNQNHG